MKTLLCLIALAVAYPALSKSVTVEIGDWRARILDEDQFASSNLITVSVATEGKRKSLRIYARDDDGPIDSVLLTARKREAEKLLKVLRESIDEFDKSEPGSERRTEIELGEWCDLGRSCISFKLARQDDWKELSMFVVDRYNVESVIFHSFSSKSFKELESLLLQALEEVQAK